MLRVLSSWILVGLAAVALGPASAQYQPPPYQPPPPPRASVSTPAPVLVYPSQVYAQPAYAAPTGFEAYKIWLIGRARREGVREATIQATIPGLQLNAR
ncbi:MAG: hypothetical protein ABIN68_02210, partial [Sphingomicrobium sp.]